jgi:hypothetical protein
MVERRVVPLVIMPKGNRLAQVPSGHGTSRGDATVQPLTKVNGSNSDPANFSAGSHRARDHPRRDRVGRGRPVLLGARHIVPRISSNSETILRLANVRPFALAAQQRGQAMRRDLYAEVSTKIAAQLEAGAAPWIKPWSATAGQNVPQNAVTNLTVS